MQDLDNLILKEELLSQNIKDPKLMDAWMNEIRYKMLSSQINPHFLFNTLETIRMKALASGDKEVATMLKILASLLRYNLSVEGKPVPLIKELDSIQNYLNIQHFRFGDRVSFDIATTCDVQNIMILPLLIQPIVENSFLHGLENKVSGGFIYILVSTDSQKPDDLLITVKDNGCGMDEEKIQELTKRMDEADLKNFSSSIGIANVSSRIKLYYGKEYGISFQSEVDEGTTVTIRIKAVSAR